jgi:tRNA-Thr(GGU) m(6)t(6)A37 methyltransferase TsaA
MDESLTEITLKPIGVVRSAVRQARGAGYEWNRAVSEIVIDRSLSEALEGLEEFSHIIVLYWMHQSAGRGEPPLKVRPRHNQDNPLVGVFASRSPHRPNSIGKATVRLLGREDNILRVKGLDAVDGTPVLDIKPYIPGYDSVRGARVPGWSKRQQKQH